MYLAGGPGINTAVVSLGTKGIYVNAINTNSKLGSELKLTNSVPAYTVVENNATVDIRGITVTASYWSLLEDKNSETGPALSGTALATTLKLGSVLINVERILGTTGNDQMFGRGANDYFIASLGYDVLSGGDGIDIVEFRSPRSAYTIRKSGSDYEITDTAGNVSRISSIEQLTFTNGSFTMAQALAQ